MNWLYQALIRPLLFCFHAERAHHLAFGALRLAYSSILGRPLLWLFRGRIPASAAVRCLGVRFANPVVLAAGFDKDARGFRALHALGFGGVEVGTITGKAQPGNPRPRLFRLKRDRALINRMGFNNAGAEAASRRVARGATWRLGINIGKTKVVEEADAAEDYAFSARLLTAHADYLVVNVSSPNTPGLRNLQATEKLRPVLEAVRHAMMESSPSRRVPLLVKIAPDLNDEDVVEVARLALELELDGIIATNTTIGREGLVTPAERVEQCGAGGASGPLLQQRSLEVLRLLHGAVGGRVTLISAGGISDAETAWERICAGASLVQVYTGFVYGGPTLPGELARGIVARANAAGFATVQAAVEHYAGPPTDVS